MTTIRALHFVLHDKWQVNDKKTAYQNLGLSDE